MPESKPVSRERARNARPKIERAALKLFVEEGIDAATTREIAMSAGVSEGALYRHYSGKDELALAPQHTGADVARGAFPRGASGNTREARRYRVLQSGR